MTQLMIDIKEYEEILYVLHVVLIEIRATDSLYKAQTVADIFHNVPMMIGRGRSAAAILEEINQKAERQGRLKEIAAMFDSARRNLKAES